MCVCVCACVRVCVCMCVCVCVCVCVWLAISDNQLVRIDKVNTEFSAVYDPGTCCVASITLAQQLSISIAKDSSQLYVHICTYINAGKCIPEYKV